ncbi:hypothetical protein GF343_04655 [Candidatus Woesearchaeota archaeon]|nr:hypothetical protein [Candidatus Woesearchaeota archaeon]
MSMIYNAWGIGAVITYLLIAVVFVIIYKITTKEFHKFTKKRLIADLIIYSIAILSLILNIIYLVDMTFLTQSVSRMIFAILFSIFALAIDFFSVHLLVCSIVNIYKYFWKKRFKKNKRDLAVGIVYLIFLNGISKKILLALITVLVLMVISNGFPQNCPQEPCGVEVVQVMPGSPAEMAGITEGEMIVTAEYGQQVKTNADFSSIVKSKKPGDSLRFETETGKKYDINLGEQDGNAYIGIATRQKLCDKTSCTMTAEVIDYTSGEPVVVSKEVYEFE